MAWWIEIAPEVVSGVKSFGLGDPEPILISLEHNLNIDDTCMTQRWDKHPNKYFVYVHVLLVDGRIHSLQFLVNDSFKEHGVLKVVWVDPIQGKPYP